MDCTTLNSFVLPLWLAFQAKFGADDELVTELKTLGYLGAVSPKVTSFVRVPPRLRKKVGANRIRKVGFACPGYVFCQEPHNLDHYDEDYVPSASGIKNATALVRVGGSCTIANAEMIQFLDMCQKTFHLKDPFAPAKKKRPAIEPVIEPDYSAMLNKVVNFQIGGVLIVGKAVAMNDKKISVETETTMFQVDPGKLTIAS